MVPKICSVDGCDRKTETTDLCGMHYQRKRKHGTTGGPNPRAKGRTHADRRPAQERFWSKVDKSGDCWIWLATKTKGDYGTFMWNGRQGLVHRFSYEQAYGPIPIGLEIDHTCHTPSCVNPAHLRAVTNKQNIENLRGARSDSRSGVRGVRQISPGIWRAGVGHNGAKVNVGCFKTLEEAEAAVIAKRIELFTHNDADRRTRN